MKNGQFHMDFNLVIEVVSSSFDSFNIQIRLSHVWFFRNYVSMELIIIAGGGSMAIFGTFLLA